MDDASYPNIKVVTLTDDTNFPDDDAECVMVGWGCTNEGK